MDEGTPSGQLNGVARAIRGCFGRLRTVADGLHAGLGITAAMRAVMEHLDVRGPATVPAIARQKLVSRQNVQVVVNHLVAAALVIAAPNPSHKRSPLMMLSARGREIFSEMRRRERSVIEDLAKDLPAAGMATTIETLAAFRRRLDKYIDENESMKSSKTGQQP